MSGAIFDVGEGMGLAILGGRRYINFRRYVARSIERPCRRR